MYRRCINRNIVECKDYNLYRLIQCEFSINRNIVECKGFLRRHRKPGRVVLIETLWNVKSIVLCGMIFFIHRINRNIVECKVQYISCINSSGTVLIETLWNVKSFEAFKCSFEKTVLIETLWNVKWLPGML